MPLQPVCSSWERRCPAQRSMGAIMDNHASPRLTRRVLGVVGVIAGVLLAACGGDDDGLA
jgi:hypothetical protein